MKKTKESIVSKINTALVQGAQSNVGNNWYTNNHIDKYRAC